MAHYEFPMLGSEADGKSNLHQSTVQNQDFAFNTELAPELYNVLYFGNQANDSVGKKSNDAVKIREDYLMNGLRKCNVETSASIQDDVNFLPESFCTMSNTISPVTHIEIIKSGSRRVTGANRVVPLLTNVLKTGKLAFGDSKLADMYKTFINDLGNNDNNKKCMICQELMLSCTELEHHIKNIHAVDVAVDQCFVCRKQYIFQDQLRIHLSQTHSINCPDLICKICFMEFNTTIEQKAHERKHDEYHICHMCSKKFSSEYLYQKHMNQHILQVKPNECKKCGKRFKNDAALNFHKKRHVNVSCTTCKIHFQNDTDLLLHIKEHKTDDIKTLLKNIEQLDTEECQLEEMLSLYSKVTLKKKINDHNNLESDMEENSILECVNTMISTISQLNDSDRSKKGTECKLCGMTVSSEKELLDHRKQFHLRNRTCPFCGKRSRSVSQTWRHMHSHILKNKVNVSKLPGENQKDLVNQSGDTNERNEMLSNAKTKQSRRNTRLYNCNICSRKFLYPGSRDNHLLQHSKEKCNNWTCTVCGQVLSHPGLLLTHASSHEPSMTCQICAKTFLSQNALQIHIKTHFGEPKKVFKCNICSIECHSLSGLQAHRRCHTGERPYTCGQCHRRFKRHQAVKKHIQVVHNSASLQYHKCTHCSKIFNSSGNLVRHYLRVHCQIRRFICGICGSRFSQNQDLRRHFKVSHKIEMPNINGSDRKALREIYVIPDIDDLSESNPHAMKIKAIVAEEKAKFSGLSEFLVNRIVDKEDPSSESVRQLIQNFPNEGGEEIVGIIQTSINKEDARKEGLKSSCSEFAEQTSVEHYDSKKQYNGDCSAGKLYLCEYCNKNFPGENEYMEHIAEQSKSYTCKQCSSVFCDQIHLNEHISFEHNILPSNISVNDLNCEDNYLKHIQNIDDVQIIHSVSTLSNELQSENCHANEKNDLITSDEQQKFTVLCNVSGTNNFISSNGISSSAISKSVLPLSNSGGHNNISTTLNINGIILQNVIIQPTSTVIQSVPLGFQSQEILNKSTQMSPVVTFNSSAEASVDSHSIFNMTHNMSISNGEGSTNPVIDQEVVPEKVKQKILVPQIVINGTVDEIINNRCEEENIQNFSEDDKQKSMAKPSNFDDDLKNNEAKERKKVKCKCCGENFFNTSSLNRHMKTHGGNKKFGCPDCGKHFSENYNLKVHMMTHTGDRPFQCEDCGKLLRYRKDVLDHKLMHLGEKPFVCEECGRKFIRQRELNRHKVIHTGEKKYECPICGQMFGRLDQLRHAHLPLHSVSNSQLKHTCLICNKSFRMKSTLKQHQTLHSGLKPYKCEVCEKSFALNGYLKAHMQCHKERHNYVQCPKCPRRFITEATLQIHDRTFHARVKKASKQSDLVKEGSYNCEDDSLLVSENIEIDRGLGADIEIHGVDLSILDANSCNAVIFLQMVPEELKLSLDVDTS